MSRPALLPRVGTPCLGALMLTLTPLLGAATMVQLKSGASVRGEVLSEKPDRVVVDLGFTLLAIPRDEIASLKAEEAVAAAATDFVEEGLFRTASNAPILSVKENVDRVAEAVVQIRTPVGLGSGFFVHPSGYIITNDHVIAGEYALSVTQYRRGRGELDRVQFNKVRVVALDSRLDLALLKIEDAGDTVFPTVPLGDSHTTTDGQAVFAIGSPLGLDRTVSNGIISQRARAMQGQIYLQTTTQINPGNSGGPLFNLRGEVVGVNNMKAMAVGVEGLNFAIPAAVLKDFLRNREAFAFDPRNPNSGYRYLSPPEPVKAPVRAGRRETAP